MIVGIGTDLCDVRRIAQTLARRGDRFAEKVLGPAELPVFHARRARVAQRGIRFLATRFSAKESFSKAIGLGIHQPMSWRSCEILNHPSGAPYIRLHGELARWFAARGWQAEVSVTDETDYASSIVIVQSLHPAQEPTRA